MEVLDYIVDRIKKHHELYDLPVFGELWEEVLHKSFKDAGQKSDWKPNRSHAVGMDIVHEEHGRISCKSGTYEKRVKKSDTLKINGSRTTQYPTLEEKLEFLSESKDDVYYCLGKIGEEWKQGLKRYYLFVFKSDILDLSKQNWQPFKTKKGNAGGWRCSNEKYSAEIRKTMSDQLWVTFNTDYLPEPYFIEV